MSKVFITGGGSKLGKELTDIFKINNFHIDSISSSNPSLDNTKYVNWDTLNLESAFSLFNDFVEGDPYDYVIFNHNAGGYIDYKNFGKTTIQEHWVWRKHYLINCQLLEIGVTKLSNRINENTRVFSMISGCAYIGKDKNASNYAGYGSMKMTQAFLMNAYNDHLKGSYYCINPGHLVTREEYKDEAQRIYSLITRPVLNKFIYNSTSGQYTNIEFNHVS